MAIPNLKLKVKQDLRAAIESEEKQGQGGKRDNRFLNYFDLKIEEKMTILFVPDIHGTVWTKFKLHGPGMKLRGAKSVRCIRDENGDCPACQVGFDIFSTREGVDQETHKAITEEGKRWMARDRMIMSCIVLDAPMDIVEDETGNAVKLFALPYNIEEHIKECLKDGRVKEEDLCTTPFVIKKSMGKGGTKQNPNSSYAHSFFLNEQIEDSDLAFLEDMVVEQYDFSDGGDVVPALPEEEEVQQWTDRALELDAKQKEEVANGGGSKRRQTNSRFSGGGGSDDKADSIKERAQASRRQAEESDPDPQPEADQPEDQESDQQVEKPRSSARERLARLQGNK